MKAKYKVGDRVKIRSDLSCWMDLPYGVDEYMEEYAGCFVTISSVEKGYHNGEYIPRYIIEEDDGDWSWSEPMFEDEDYFLDKLKDFLDESF